MLIAASRSPGKVCAERLEAMTCPFSIIGVTKKLLMKNVLDIFVHTNSQCFHSNRAPVSVGGLLLGCWNPLCLALEQEVSENLHFFMCAGL